MKYIPAFLKAYSDSSFTNPHEVVLADDPKDCRGDFTHMGAKYWGFETLRHKATSVDSENQSYRYDDNRHHWFEIGFKSPALVSRVSISTKWFTGNQVPSISVVVIRKGIETRLFERITLKPDADLELNFDELEVDSARIECYHEGGISRVNFFGQNLDQYYRSPKNLLETAEISHVSNDHFGHPSWAVKGNREETHMVGWESARWGFGEQAVFKLKSVKTPTKLIVDTYLHRLNPPLSCHVFGFNADSTGMTLDEALSLAPKWQLTFDSGRTVVPDNFQQYMNEKLFLNEAEDNPSAFTIKLAKAEQSPWVDLVPFGALYPDRWHEFEIGTLAEPVTHILYTHYPNGGVHGLKLFDE